MTLENERKLLFFPAYYKRRYVNVPLVHLPEEAITNDGDIVQFRFIPVDNPPKIDPLPLRESRAAEKYSAFQKVTINPEELSDKELKLLCKTNDIEISWVTDRFSKKASRAGSSHRRREIRKIRSLTHQEFEKIIVELEVLEKQSALIVSVLWFLNSSLKGGGAYITLEELLRALIHDFSPQEEGIPAQIRLKRFERNPHIASHYLPEKLGKSVLRQIKRNSMFVFSNRYCGPLLPVKIDSDLKKAAKKAGIKDVTSLSFRPQYNRDEPKQNTKNYQKELELKDCLEQVSDQEWETIRKSIPTINERRGRKSTYQPRDLLNGIFYHLKNKCPLRKLPSSYPPWRAVDSQHRRWKKRGIIEAILNLRKKVSSV
jgi:hypothetical protein